MYQSVGSAGMDLCAMQRLTIEPGDTALVSTGVSAAIPPGYEGQIRPRSGLALKHGVTVLNAPGTIDSDYRGEIKVLLINLGKEAFEVNYDARIAQLVICPVVRAELRVGELETTERGEGGFGSTGVAA